jgi:ABC-type enterobactin transport system permease subunit
LRHKSILIGTLIVGTALTHQTVKTGAIFRALQRSTLHSPSLLGLERGAPKSLEGGMRQEMTLGDESLALIREDFLSS